MREQIADICRKAKYSIKNFKSDPVNNLEYLIPIAIFLIGIINGIVTQRAFAHNGGYGAQMDAIKEYGLFDGYSEKFTTGTTGLILHGFWGKVILILAGIQLMLIFYKCIKNNANAFILLLVVSGLLVVFQIFMTDCLFASEFSTVYMSQETFEICYEKISGIMYDIVEVVPDILVVAVYAIISIGAVIGFLFSVYGISMIENNGRTIKNTALVLAFSMILVPLVLLFLQNVVPLLSGVLAVVLMVAIIVICFVTFIGGLTEGGGEAAQAKSVRNESGSSPKREKAAAYSNMKGERKMTEKESKVRRVYVEHLNEIGGCELYRMHSFLKDYIVRYNGIVDGKICTVEEFQSGKVQIYDKATGRRIPGSEIPWKK